MSGAPQVVESLDGALSPDTESAEMSSWSEMSDVESVDVEVVDSWDVSACSGEGLAVIVTDDKRSSSVLEPSVSHLALSASELLGESDSVEVLVDSESLHDFNGIFSSGDRVD